LIENFCYTIAFQTKDNFFFISQTLLHPVLLVNGPVYFPGEKPLLTVPPIPPSDSLNL